VADEGTIQKRAAHRSWAVEMLFLAKVRLFRGTTVGVIGAFVYEWIEFLSACMRRDWAWLAAASTAARTEEAGGGE
jgi:hypothetical protein